MKIIIQTVSILSLVFVLACCVNQSTPVKEANYSTKIVGSWQGRVGGSNETMIIDRDGTFRCQLQPTAFISTMLFPPPPGSVHGIWKLNGTILTLIITGGKNERVMNQSTSSTIVNFRTDKLVLRSDRDGTSAFQRVNSF